MRPHRQQPTRVPCPWDSPGKNPAVGCHFLLQCMKVKSESEVTQPVRWVQLSGSLSTLWHCLSLGLKWKLTFSSPVATAKKVALDFSNVLCMRAQLCSILCNPINFSPPGSSVHGIFQAGMLEWVAISSSNINVLFMLFMHVFFHFISYVKYSSYYYPL